MQKSEQIQVGCKLSNYIATGSKLYLSVWTIVHYQWDDQFYKPVTKAMPRQLSILHNDQFIFLRGRAISYTDPDGQLSTLHEMLKSYLQRKVAKAELGGQLSTFHEDQIIFLQAISYTNPCGQLSTIHEIKWLNPFIKARWTIVHPSWNDQIIFFLQAII